MNRWRTILYAAVIAMAVTGAGALQPTLRCDWVGPVAPATTPGVILQTDFESPDQLGPDLLEYYDCHGGFMRAQGAGYGGSAGMRCTFEKGQVEGGNIKYVFGKNPFRRGPRQNTSFHDIYWRVYVRHQAGWEGNPAKLTRALCMAGSDWSEGLMAHVWGGKGDTLCIDPASGITDSRKITDKYNDFPHLRWLGLRNADTPVFNPTEAGRWICIESRVKVNTPAKSDGVFALWIDGKLEAQRNDLDWHGTWDEYGINAVFLENYWNAGSLKKQSRCFDDVVVATQPIGPISVGPNPQIHRTDQPCAKWQARLSADPEGRSIVWTSGELSGAATSVTAKSGNLTGGNKVYWVSVRQLNETASWSDWSAWHSPFRISQ